MKLSKIFWLCKSGVLLFFILLIMGIKRGKPGLTAVGVLVLIISAVGFQVKYRCPYCHRVLDSRKLIPEKICRHCGGNLHDK